MENFWRHLAETKIAVSIYSDPHFAFEIFLVAFVCFAFAVVYVNLKHYRGRKKTDNCASQYELKVLKRSSSSATIDTLCTNAAYVGSECDFYSTTSSPHPPNAEKYNFLTFEEYLVQENSVKSLRHLCNEVLERESSQYTVRRHLEMAKEHLQLAKCCLGSGDDRDKQMMKVTDSLFELLQRIILSGNNVKCFRGDMAELAAEIADLSLDV